MARVLAEETEFPKRLIASALGIARGSLYYERQQPVIDKRIADAIYEVYETDDTLGCRKLGPLLGRGKNQVFRVMVKYGIQPRRKRPKYNYPGKSDDVVDNVLLKQDVEDNTVLFSDIFQFRLADGTWVYVCFVIRKKTRQILSMAYGYSMRANLVVETIKRVDLQPELGDPEVIFHSDQGKQYGAKVTVDTILSYKFSRSMSRAGTPTDNGMAERFVQSFKLAVVERYRYENIHQFEEFATKWLNFYNNTRPHQSLEQKAPNEYAAENSLPVIPYLYLNFV
jgi:transposase InsO family protein